MLTEVLYWHPKPWARTAFWALPWLLGYGFITETEMESMLDGLWETGGEWLTSP